MKSMLHNLSLACVLMASAFASTAEQTDWPHPRGGLQGLGVAEVELQDQYTPAWTYKTGGAVLSSPIIVDGVVYVGSEDKHLHAIDAETGQEKWKLASETLIDASPVYADGVVYIGTDGGVLYAVDTQTGEPKWQFKTEGRIAGEVAVTQMTNGAGAFNVVLFGRCAESGPSPHWLSC